jgi:hypothetical protein
MAPTVFVKEPSMFDTTTHEMELLSTDETGADEWYCRICGRHFRMRWPPEYARVVLVAGDEEATHVGGKGGLHMGELQVESAPEADQPQPEQREPAPHAEDPQPADELLDPWRHLLGSLDDQS